MQLQKATRVGVRLTMGFVAVIDSIDAKKIMRFKWYALKTKTGYYAARNAPMKNGVRGKTLLMHRIIANTPNHLRCDHRNGDTLDNRRKNLRNATQSQNGANSKSRGGTSKFKGVNWDKDRGRWISFITVNGKRHNLGRYRSEESAAMAYDSAAKSAFGEFAKTNFIS